MPPVRARLATFGYFGLNGFVLGLWVVHIPLVKDRTGIDDATLGGLLLLLGVAAWVGMQLGGRLLDAFGSRTVLTLSAAALGLSLLGPALASSAVALALGLAVLGFVNGVVDVSQNAHAVEVERLYHRPVMSAFHALFSLGGLLAALVGGPLLAAGVQMTVTLTVAGALMVLAAFWLSSRLLRTTTERSSSDTPRRRAPWTARVILLGLLAFTLMLSEGVAYDWSAVHLRDSLGAPASVAAWAFGAFSATMTIVRLLADRVVGRVGPAAYVQGAALIGAAGLVGVAIAPSPAAAIAAWAVFGVGLAGCVPQLFSAAGNIDSTVSGTYLARVAGMGYLGLLAGPSIIGLLRTSMPLTTAFVVPVVGCLLAAALARTALHRAPR